MKSLNKELNLLILDIIEEIFINSILLFDLNNKNQIISSSLRKNNKNNITINFEKEKKHKDSHIFILNFKDLSSYISNPIFNLLQDYYLDIHYVKGEGGGISIRYYKNIDDKYKSENLMPNKGIDKLEIVLNKIIELL